MALTPEQQAFDANKDGKLTGAEVTSYNDAVTASTVPLSTTANPKSGTDVDTSVTRLTYESAKALLEKSIESLGEPLKLTNEDIKRFMEIFKAEQDKQIAKTVTTSATKTTPGVGENAVDKVVSSTQKSEYPSFFNPTQTAQDFIWSKIEFKDEANLGPKSLDAIAKVRGLVDSFQLLGVSDTEAKVAARQIAMGKKTIEAYTVELQQIAKKEYPQFADRFASDPTLTTYDIASPIINMLAKTWAVDAKSIKMTDPIVNDWLHFAGPDGKGQQPSYNDLVIKAKKHPKYQETPEANENARNAATELGRALGYGV